MQSTSLAGRSILIVEDEPIIALDIVDAFRKVGATTRMAQTVADAVHLVEEDGLSAAVIDFGLRDGDADAICARLRERAIPFILHSGYSHGPDAYRGGTIVPKPADPAVLVRTVIGLLPDVRAERVD